MGPPADGTGEFQTEPEQKLEGRIGAAQLEYSVEPNPVFACDQTGGQAGVDQPDQDRRAGQDQRHWGNTRPQTDKP